MSAKHKGDTGGSLGGRMDMSPARRRKRKAAREREERQWAAHSGPVTTKKAVPDSRQAISGTAHETPTNQQEHVMPELTNSNIPVYATRTEAVEREIIEPIEASVVVADARADYDVDAIADKVLVFDDHLHGFILTVDTDEFWLTVSANARPASNVAPPRGFHTIPGDDDANPAVYVGYWIQEHGLDVAVEFSRERGLEIRDGEGAPMTTQQVEALIQRLHQLIGAYKVAAAELEQRKEGGDK